MNRRTIRGTMRFLRSPSDEPKCVCCKGNHVFCRFIDTRPRKRVQLWLSDVEDTIPEGARVRIEITWRLEE
jgi:hypothetical protein